MVLFIIDTIVVYGGVSYLSTIVVAGCNLLAVLVAFSRSQPADRSPEIGCIIESPPPRVPKLGEQVALVFSPTVARFKVFLKTLDELGAAALSNVRPDSILGEEEMLGSECGDLLVQRLSIPLGLV
jgi:hypothetical protein